MRKIIYAFLFLFSTHFFGQSPSRINYQGIVRDNAGQALANKNVKLEFIILQGASPGTSVFSETLSVQTNSMGLFSVQIGSSSNLGSVNFYSGTYSLQVNLDASGGNSFSPMGGPQLLASVPFALHANTVPATFSNNVLTIGTNNSFTLSLPGASNPTIQSSGVAVVSPSTGLNFTVDVPAPALTISGNTLTLTQGTAVSSATVPVYTPSISALGILTSTASGSNFTLNVSPVSIAVTSTAGAAGVSSLAPNNFTINIPPASTASLVSSGAASTTTLGTNSYSVHVPPTSIVVTTLAGVGAVTPAGTNSFNINIPPIIQYTSGTGISITSGTVINNTAPDQIVAITGTNGVTVNGIYPNFTVSPPPVSLSGAGIVTVSPGPAFVVGTPPPNFASVGPASITGVYPNLTVNSPVTPSVSAAGIASVSAGPNYNVGVQSPSFTSVGPSSITGVYPNLTITSPVTPTVTAAGIASVSAGPNYNVGVQSPSFTSVGPSSITGVYPNLTITSPVTPTVTAAGIATVSAGPNYVVGVQQPTFAYSQVTGSLTSGTSSEYITPNLSYSAGILTSGPASNSIAINSGTNALWSTLGNSATNPTSNFIGTTDNLALNFRVNNQPSGTIDQLLFNTALGYQSLVSLTSGTMNTALGYRALNSLTSAHRNTAIGAEALRSVSTGNENTAIGYSALQNNTTGSSNIGIGFLALSNNNSTFNLAMGNSALASNSSGNSNVAIGTSALFANSTGNYNVSIGHASGNSTNGTANVFVGYAAGNTNTGSGNVFLGYQAGFNAVGSNKLFIANSSTTVTPLIYGDFTTGRVAIGNATTQHKFNVGDGTADAQAINVRSFINSTGGWQGAGAFGGSVASVIFGELNGVAAIGGHDATLSTWDNLLINPGGGNVGIGTTAPNAPLQFGNFIVNRKIVLWEGANNDHQFYGLGINGGTLRYQVDATSASHVFYAGTGAGTSNEIFRVNGTGHIKMGNETGTAQGPVYPVNSNGLIIRRIFTNFTAAGSIVARTDNLLFERDGTNGGFRVNRTGGSGLEVCNCMAVNSAGGAVNRALNNLAAGVTQVYTNADNIVYLHCIIADPYSSGHSTEITLTREFADWYWLGTIMTTFNQ